MYIGSSAFLCCEKLTEVTISNAAITIDECAFEGCNNLTITIPKDINKKKIGFLAFHKVKEVKYDETI